MKIKLKKNSSIRTNGLYDLEEIMGECTGHGCGFDSEDIDWEISENKDNESWNAIDIHEKNGFIYLRYIKFYGNPKRNPISMGLGKLPQKWLEKIQEVIVKHCSNEVKDIALTKSN